MKRADSKSFDRISKSFDPRNDENKLGLLKYDPLRNMYYYGKSLDLECHERDKRGNVNDDSLEVFEKTDLDFEL